MSLADTDSLLRSMRLTSELAIEFFITFARFEYALIAAGFASSRRDGSVEADWHRLTTILEGLGDSDLALVLEVGAQLSVNPPKRLVLKNGRAEFESTGRDGQSEIRFLIENVKRARNNLFHGGKYLTAPAPADRNESVVSDSLKVLRAILEIPEIVVIRNAYNETSS